MNNSTSFLRKALKANAVFSFISGIAFTVFYQPIGSLIGIQPVVMTLITGLILVGFSLFVWYTAQKDEIGRIPVWVIIDMDILWVAGTAYSIISGEYSYAGSWIMGIISLLVLDFAIAQYIGLRKATPQPTTASQ